MSWLGSNVWETAPTLAVCLSCFSTLLILTLPKPYSHFQPHRIPASAFTQHDKHHPDKSGYGLFDKHKDDTETLCCESSVQIVVLGDIGRSPRMQYHALSLATHGVRVFLIGYVESDVHPDILTHRLITVVPIAVTPPALITSNKLLFLLLAPLKVLWQIWSLYRALGYTSPACKFILVQNPPSIPTLAVSQAVAFLRRSHLVIDWHNFGYSILALRLGEGHPLVQISQWYEGWFSRGAAAHLCVTNAMARVLQAKWAIDALPLHDRPPAHFQPLSAIQRADTLRRLSVTAPYASELTAHTRRLIVSSTSWTPDEDFTVLLDALTAYSDRVAQAPSAGLPKLLAVITGKGPQKSYYLAEIEKLRRAGRLPHVEITTAWLTMSDYAALLGSADLGVSLHTSSSGVDLPMKVVDMFGTGLPVAGWSKFEAWPELVTEGYDGRGFESADELCNVLTDVFSQDGKALELLRTGARKACQRRWDDEWMPVAGKLFQVRV